MMSKFFQAIFTLMLAAMLPVVAQPRADVVKEIAGYRTVEGAEVSARALPVAARYVYGKEREWRKQPYRLAVIMVEFSDQKHEAAHTAAFYEELMFSRQTYFKTPGGEVSFGSVADWYRTQSQDRFELGGKVFEWVTVDETFEAIHALKLKEAQERYLKVALAKVRARDGAKALDGFDGYLFVHVGPITGPSGNIFWSHRADVEGKRYITTGEIERIGVICHEFGHILGLPDFYAKKGVREGFGPWCAMASGYRGTYPKSFSVWSKTRLGWCVPTVIDGTVAQKLVLRPIQSHPNDAIAIPLNGVEGVGAEFLLLENRVARGTDAEGQAGLFIWRITRKADSGGFPVYELTLPGPGDAAVVAAAGVAGAAGASGAGASGRKVDQDKRRVAWPEGAANEYTVEGKDGVVAARIRGIRKEGDLVFFEVGVK